MIAVLGVISLAATVIVVTRRLIERKIAAGIAGSRSGHVPAPPPATTRRSGLLATLPAAKATITYSDAEGRLTTRQVAVHHLTGLREPDGDTLYYAEAWCFLRRAPRMFGVARIKSLTPACTAVQAASPEAWLREQAGTQLRPEPARRRTPSRAGARTVASEAAEELLVLFSGVEFEALIRVCKRDPVSMRNRTEDLRFQVHEIAALPTGGLRELRGTDLATGRRRSIYIENVVRVADPRTGEIAGARRQWLKDRAAESVDAGYGQKLFEPAKPRRRKTAPQAGARAFDG